MEYLHRKYIFKDQIKYLNLVITNLGNGRIFFSKVILMSFDLLKTKASEIFNKN